MTANAPDTTSGSCRHSIRKSHRTSGHNPEVLREFTSAAATLGLAAALVLLASGCTETPARQTSSAAPAVTATTSASARPLTITSDELPAPAPLTDTATASTPARIVTLATGVGEIVAALGLGDRVVGRDETSDAPSIAGAPILTEAHSVSAERVLSTQPDLVIIDAATAPAEALDQIRATGTPVVEVPEAWSLADIGARTQVIAEALGVSPQAADTVVAEATLRAPAPSMSTSPRVAFLYLRGTSAIYLMGGRGSGADDLITQAGGVDVGVEAGLSAFVPLTAEALATADPDVLLVMTGGLESVGGIDGLSSLPGIAQTRAGRERRVIAVDDTLLLSFGPRTGAVIDALAADLATLGP